MTAQLECGDCLEIMSRMADDGVQFDACVTDPPYHLSSIVKRFGSAQAAPAQFGTDGVFSRASRGFMGKTWDGGDIAMRPETWSAILRVLKPGAHLAAFGGTRTFHRMVCAIEDAGFEIRDSLCWLYASGFPKSYDVAQSIEKKLTTGKARRPDRDLGGLSRNRFSGSEDGTLISDTGGKIELTTAEALRWEGWGTALKPSREDIILARRPLIGTVADNVLAHGTGGINVDACRIGNSGGTRKEPSSDKSVTSSVGGCLNAQAGELVDGMGRWPANTLHDGSAEVEAAFAAFGESKSPRTSGKMGRSSYTNNVYGHGLGGSRHYGFGDSGSASRFFFTAKANTSERFNSKHPTVKPLTLMKWLCTLITPPGGTILDPFAGSGSTLEAAVACAFNAVGCEQDTTYQEDIRRRIAAISKGLFF